MEEETTTSVTKSTWQKSKLVTNIVVTLAIIGVTCYVSYIVGFKHYHFVFTWHVFFGAVAYLLLMPESFMIFDDVWFTRFSRKYKSWIHGGVVGVATVFAFISVILDYYRKEYYKPKYDLVHFESPHAITGLISIILLLFGTSSGFITANITWFRKNVASVRPVVLKLSHNILGQLGYLFGILSILLIFFTSWFAYKAGETGRAVVSLLIILTTLWALLNSFISAYTQVSILRS